MTLIALIKKGGLARAATMTPATIATHTTDQGITVALVAAVTVALKPVPLPESKRQFTISRLSTIEETKIRAWLTNIEETDSKNITEILDKCRTDVEARLYFLHRAEEIPRMAAWSEPITCGDCCHFKRIDHPNLGHCAKGELEAIAGLWDTTKRNCKSYLSVSEPITRYKSMAKEVETGA